MTAGELQDGIGAADEAEEVVVLMKLNAEPKDVVASATSLIVVLEKPLTFSLTDHITE